MQGPDGLFPARAAYADTLAERCSFRSEAVRDALAAVPREDFLGPPPWSVSLPGNPFSREETDDPEALYRDVTVAIEPARGLNNGSPLLWANAFGLLEIARAERVVHIGTGTGYYTALLAELVGPEGEVLGVEVDAELAARTRANLKRWPWVRTLHADGSRQPEKPGDVIVVNAGATHLVAPWLDGLRLGGRLYVPLTVELEQRPQIGGGMALLVTRTPEGLAARLVHGIGIFHCAGARSAENERALARAFEARDRILKVRSVRRERHAPDDRCWLHVPGACLSTAAPGEP